MNLVLIGFRGSGKSAVGKALARRMEMEYVDTDESLERSAGLSIREVVERYGWEGFRERECAVVQAVSELDRQVISTGGGVVLASENVRNLRRNGRILLLSADPDALLERLRRDPGTRDRRPPLGTDQWDREVRDALEKRAPYYLDAADHVVDTTRLSVPEVVAAVLQWWEETG
jgi:shikimate kinase